jgi:hemolysin III
MTQEVSHRRFVENVYRLGEQVSVLAGVVKPKLRGWIHAVMAPLVSLASITLIVVAPTTSGKVTSAIFGIASVLLFTVSGVYHRGKWTPLVAGILRMIDHANIFLIIAGTYTPLSVALLEPSQAKLVLTIVWGGSLIAIISQVFWVTAPRWFYVPIYVALGWVAVAFLPSFAAAGGAAVMWLVIVGGLAYTMGAVVYAVKCPNPSPRWFGFHEIFHLLTAIGFITHYVAVYLAVVTSK